MLRSISSPQRKTRLIALKTKAGSISLSIAAAQVTNASNSFESTAHGLVTGDRILTTEVGTLPAGVSDATQYWIIKVDDDNFQLATTYANALAGTAQALGDDGVGSNTYALVEELDGLDKFQASVKATAVGTYAITLDSAFAEAPVVVGNVAAADKAVTIDSVTTSVITVKVNDIDETAALSDGFFHIMILGSDVTDRY